MSEYKDIVAFWRQKEIKNDAELAEALNGHSIAFAYHSGKIENDQITYNDTREVFEHDGVTNYTGDLRTLFEIRNEKDAYELLLKAFNEKRKLDEELLKEFQYQLTKNTYDVRRWQLNERPGEYKKHDYITGRYEVGSLPEDVHDEIVDLLEELQSFPKEKVLIAAAYFHARIESIHPFADGNGRTGRIVMNYLLLINDHPPIILHEEDRKEYYSSLETWDEKEELGPLIQFLEKQTVKTWIKQAERSRTL